MIRKFVLLVLGSAFLITTGCQKAPPNNVPDGAVDLGIVMTREDGSTYTLYWAACNLGAKIPEEYGDYYAWGETRTKPDYSWATYKFRTSGDNWDNIRFSKYVTWEQDGPVDNKTVLDLEDDVAHVRLGDKWRMPTDKEWDALSLHCAFRWTSMNGQIGYEIKSIINGNSIFLPAAGYQDGTEIIDVDFIGSYWCSSFLEDYDCPSRMVIDSQVWGCGTEENRYKGLTIRPVTE